MSMKTLFDTYVNVMHTLEWLEIVLGQGTLEWQPIVRIGKSFIRTSEIDLQCQQTQQGILQDIGIHVLVPELSGGIYTKLN